MPKPISPDDVVEPGDRIFIHPDEDLTSHEYRCPSVTYSTQLLVIQADSQVIRVRYPNGWESGLYRYRFCRFPSHFTETKRMSYKIMKELSL